MRPEDLGSNQTLFNYTQSDQYDYQKYCGFNNCPSDKLPAVSSKTSLLTVYILCIVLICLCILSILITIALVDNIGNKTKTRINKMIKEEILNIFNLTKSVDLYLLIPIAIYSGFELTFMWSEFNRVS